MIFRKATCCISSFKFDKYEPFEIPEDTIKEARTRTKDNPYLEMKDGVIRCLYCHNGELHLEIYGSFYGFKEGVGIHETNQEANDWKSCKCGEIFKDGKRISKEERFANHIKEIANIGKDENE